MNRIYPGQYDSCEIKQIELLSQFEAVIVYRGRRLRIFGMVSRRFNPQQLQTST